MTPLEKSFGEATTAEEKALEGVVGTIPGWAGRQGTYARVPGGISNYNWRVALSNEKRRYFLKIPGKGTELFVNRQASNEAACRAHAAGIAPKVVHFDATSGVEVSDFLDGFRATTNVDFLSLDVRRKVVGLYREFHRATPLSLGKTIFDMIDEHLQQLAAVGASTPADIDWLQRQYGNVKAAFLASGLDIVPCFNDPMPGNFLVNGNGDIKLVDFEFASNNERHFDLGVWFGEMFFDEEVVLELIEEYFGRVTAWSLSRIMTMRALADLKWACWAMIQEQISELKFDYHKYGTWKFVRARSLMHDPRWAMWMRQI